MSATASAVAPKERSDLRRLFVEEATKAAGSTGGKWIMGVVIGLLVLAAAFIFRRLFVGPHQ